MYLELERINPIRTYNGNRKSPLVRALGPTKPKDKQITDTPTNTPFLEKYSEFRKYLHNIFYLCSYMTYWKYKFIMPRLLRFPHPPSDHTSSLYNTYKKSISSRDKWKRHFCCVSFNVFVFTCERVNVLA